MEWRNIQASRRTFGSMLKGARSVIVFDTETTGLGKSAKIIEFAAIRYEFGEKGLVETASVDYLIDPCEPLSEKIIEITGITDEMLAGRPTEAEIAHEIYNFMASADVWAAYNCSFDLRMLEQMSQRIGQLYTKRPCMDILTMARDFISKDEIESHKLESVTSYLYPDHSYIQFHNALDDTKAATMCLVKFLMLYKHHKSDTEIKHQCHVNWIAHWVNPKAPSQQRIKLNLTEGNYGDIFYDCVKKTWSCKAEKSAKKLFSSIDMENIESQVLNRYGAKFGVWTMEELALAMAKKKKAV